MSAAPTPLQTVGRRSAFRSRLVLMLAVAMPGCGGRVQPNGEEPPSHQVPRASFLDAVQTAICAQAELCCPTAGLRLHQQCRAQVQTVWQPKLDRADQVKATYDPIQAGICVAELQAEWTACAPTKTSTSRSEDVCARVFSAPAPRQTLGAPCFSTMDCQQAQDVSVLCLVVDGALPGACVRHELGTEGAHCGGADGHLNAECQAPFICGSNHTCQRRLRQGERCANFKSDACAAGLVCDAESSGVCVPALPLGSAAAASSNCEGYCRVNDTCRICPDLPIWLYCE